MLALIEHITTVSLLVAILFISIHIVPVKLLNQSILYATGSIFFNLHCGSGLSLTLSGRSPILTHLASAVIHRICLLNLPFFNQCRGSGTELQIPQAPPDYGAAIPNRIISNFYGARERNHREEKQDPRPIRIRFCGPAPAPARILLSPNYPEFPANPPRNSQSGNESLHDRRAAIRDTRRIRVRIRIRNTDLQQFNLIDNYSFGCANISVPDHSN